MNSLKLLNKNFVLIVLGQVISLYGNTMLRFALPLYILDTTGNETLFGSILALAMIPTILFSPLGGILADRVNKKMVMVVLDIITACTIALLMLVLQQKNNELVTISIVLVVLSIIQSFYQPAVQSSIPRVVSRDNIIKGNAIVTSLNSLANLIGPLLGGLLYGFFGLTPILIGSTICFGFAAIMESFVYIPKEYQKNKGSFIKVIKDDIKESVDFIIKDRKIILKIVFLATFINLALSALIIVGYPIFIKLHFNLSSQLYGVSEAVLAVGSITGAILVGMIGKKLPIEKFYLILLIPSIFLLPIALPFLLELNSMQSYFILLLCGYIIMVSASMFSVRTMSLLQEITPGNILAKITSYVLTLAMLALPLGQVIYGYLFNILSSQIYVIIIVASLLCLIIGLASKKVMIAVSKEI